MLWFFIIAIAVIYYFLHHQIAGADVLLFADMEDELPVFLQDYYFLSNLLVKVLGGLIIFLPALDTSGEFWEIFISCIVASGILTIIRYFAMAKGSLVGRDIFRRQMKTYSETWPEKKTEYLEMAKMDIPEILSRGKDWTNLD